MSRTSIETISGSYLDFANPSASALSVQTIAWGISRQPRFAGQTLGTLAYNVAQHSVHVAALVEQVMTYGSRLNRKVESTSDQILQAYLNDRLALEKDLRTAMLLGLFHDGSEGFLCDLPTPAKRLAGLGPEYSKVEKPLMAAVHELIGIDEQKVSPEVLKIVHWADAYALAIEVYFLIPSRGQDAQWGHLLQTDLQDRLEWEPALPAIEAFKLFVNCYAVLKSA